MTSAKRLVLAVLMVAFVPAGTGCWKFIERIAPPVMGEEREHLKGSWVGALKSVTVSDREGRTYEATALVLESGPDLATAGPVAEDPVLLVRTREEPHRILNPRGLPLGSRVLVNGAMIADVVSAPASNVPRNSAVEHPISIGVPFTDKGARVIILHGDPKVLN